VLSEITSAFKGFFSRAFWFGNFLPVIVFAAVHVAIAWWVGVISTAAVESWIKVDAKQLAYFPMAVAAFIVLAYALAPLVPLLRGMLDGSLLPESWYNFLVKEHMISARAIRSKVRKAFLHFTDTSEIEHKYSGLISAARAIGNDHGGIHDVPAIDDAVGSIAALQQQFDSGDVPCGPDLIPTARLLITALLVNATNEPGDANAVRLDDACGQFARILADAEADAQNRYIVMQSRNSRIAYDNPQATRMADTRMLVESYCSKTYGVSFEYLWPRLQLVLPQLGSQGDVGSFSDKLTGARAQIDFALLSLGLSLSIPVVWLPYVVCKAHDPTVFLVLAAAGPLLIGFFYQVAVESQAAFGDVMKAAVDAYRLDLLAKLHQPLPPTLSAERELWRRLEQIEGVQQELFYRHPTRPS
jgi:hypothetical protein